MSRRAILTKTELKRRLEAVLLAGMAVTEIRPDGTIVLGAAAYPAAADKSAADIALETWRAQKN